MKIRVSKYYPYSAWGKHGIRCIARLDGGNPVTIMNDKYATNVVVGKALNLFDIIELFKKHIPKHEDWYIAYKSGFDFNEDLRNRDIRKYTKAMVYYILMRLATHNVFKCFSHKDIFVNNWDGEVMSYFRPYKTIHICNNSWQCD